MTFTPTVVVSPGQGDAQQVWLQDLNGDMERMRGDYNRLRQEAQEKIDKLMERIKELNQRLMGPGGSRS